MKKLGFGMMRLPLTEAGNSSAIDQKRVNKMIDDFFAAGFTYIDTAYPYHQGMSEAAVRKAVVERYPREAFVLADKMPTFLVTCPEDYPRIFAEQLERTGVEYFDYYLLHSLSAGHYADTLKCDGFAFMKKLKEEGKAKHIGFSYHDSAELLEKILIDHPEMEFVQLQINYIDWDSESIESRKCYEVACKYGKPVIVMEPVKGGCLAEVPEEAEKIFRSVHPDWSAASWAIRYPASLANVLTVLSGMSNEEQLAENMNILEGFTGLGKEEYEAIDKVVDVINASIAIPCTNCRYCVDGCPQQIAIPDYFSLYNNQNRFRLMASHRDYYTGLSVSGNPASACIECGQCESHCPQHIKIIDELKKVAEVFE